MKFTVYHMFIIGVLAIVIGGSVTGFLYRVGFTNREGMLMRVGEGFQDSPVQCNRCGAKPCGCNKRQEVANCNICGAPKPCGCMNRSDSVGSRGVCPPVLPCPRTIEPDLSKYVLKSSIPPSRQMPDLSNYMMKSECPAVPDLSKYVLRSSIPKPQPVIIDNSSCKKDAGECPPCIRPRCPVVKCPPPTVCPRVADCPRQVCPKTVVKCKSEEQNESVVRPFLAPLNMSGFGSA